jgi:3-keto-disaccharide hydrolase
VSVLQSFDMALARVRPNPHFVLALSSLIACTAAPASSASQSTSTNPYETTLMKWPQHSMDRPKPPVIRVGALAGPVSAPSDAIVLFDGHDLSKWTVQGSNTAAKWKIENGYMEVVAKTGNIETKQGFGDVQLHVEWMAPTPAEGEGQDRGNSGVFLMRSYELQVLDSYDNVTYADGQAGAVFGQYPPLVNASRPPGQWQTYDIIFHRPRFDANGSVQAPARMTVFQNGVVVQDDVTLTGPTAFQRRPSYSRHPDRMPLGLQDHAHPVRYRNIWIRDLESGAR